MIYVITTAIRGTEDLPTPGRGQSQQATGRFVMYFQISVSEAKRGCRVRGGTNARANPQPKEILRASCVTPFCLLRDEGVRLDLKLDASQ